MRFNYIFLSFIFFCNFSFSQIRLGIDGGVTMSDLRGDAVPDNDKAIYSFYISPNIEIPLYKKISFKGAIAYEKKGDRFNTFIIDPYNENGGVAETSNTFSYLTVPLLLRYSTTGKILFFVNAGPNFSLLLKSTGIEIANLDMGITSGLGVGINFGENRFSFELRNSLGVKNIQDSKIKSRNDLKTNSFYLLLGYSMKL